MFLLNTGKYFSGIFLGYSSKNFFFRVLYVNGVTVLWDIFLSYIKHKPEDDSDTERENVIKNAAQL